MHPWSCDWHLLTILIPSILPNNNFIMHVAAFRKVCMRVCIHPCTIAPMHSCTHEPMHLSTHAHIHPCTCESMHPCTHELMHSRSASFRYHLSWLCVLKQGRSLAWHSPSSPGWLARKPLTSDSLALRLQTNTTQHTGLFT